MQAIKKVTAQPSRLVTLHEYLLMQAVIMALAVRAATQ